MFPHLRMYHRHGSLIELPPLLARKLIHPRWLPPRDVRVQPNDAKDFALAQLRKVVREISFHGRC